MRNTANLYLTLAIVFFFAGVVYFAYATSPLNGIEEKPSLEEWRQMMKVETLPP